VATTEDIVKWVDSFRLSGFKPRDENKDTYDMEVMSWGGKSFPLTVTFQAHFNKQISKINALAVTTHEARELADEAQQVAKEALSQHEAEKERAAAEALAREQEKEKLLAAAMLSLSTTIVCATMTDDEDTEEDKEDDEEGEEDATKKKKKKKKKKTPNKPPKTADPVSVQKVMASQALQDFKTTVVDDVNDAVSQGK
jgi:hypothetical protein